MKNNGHFIPLCIFLLTAITLRAQEEYPLYQDSIPNNTATINYEIQETGDDGKFRIRNVTVPTLTAYLPDPDRYTGKSVIICPGGGYYLLATGHEGTEVARALQEQGIAAFVLKYRLPRDSTMRDKRIGPLQDAQKSIQWVRENAEQLGLGSSLVGIMGFSAGGHLAATAGTLYDQPVIPNPEEISLRPDFMVLVYPVITSREDIRHTGSFRNLLGDSARTEDLELFSPDLQVKSDTPPAYFVHARNDKVKVENSLVFMENLDRFDIPFDSTMYESGGHGFGLVNPSTNEEWLPEMIAWLDQVFE